MGASVLRPELDRQTYVDEEQEALEKGTRPGKLSRANGCRPDEEVLQDAGRD
jgi:hypothetical protein